MKKSKMSQISCLFFSAIIIPLITIFVIFNLNYESSYKIIDHEYDVVVLGAGGSGLRAAVGLK